MEPMTKQIAPGTAIGTSSDRDESRGLEIMAVEFTTPDRNKHKVFFGYPIDRNDYLKRGWWEKRHWWDTLPDFDVRYQKNIQRILERAFRRDVVLRTIHLPPFDPEWIVGVIQSSTGYRAFRLDASYFIWQAQEDEKDKLPQIHGNYRDKPLATATALRLVALWRRFLSDHKNYGTEKNVMYGDSSHFIFSVDHITANTMAWEKGTKAAEVIQVSDDLYEFVADIKDAAAVEHSLQKAERKLGLRSCHETHLTRRCS